jgi:hypothetical protein
MAMRTLGIAAPEGPFTVPVIDPPATWALVVEGATKMKAISATSNRNIFFEPIDEGFVCELFEKIRRPTGNIPSSIAEFTDRIPNAFSQLINRPRFLSFYCIAYAPSS